MTGLRTLALITALLALSGCKDLNEGLNLLQGKPVGTSPLGELAADVTDDAAQIVEAVSPPPPPDEHSPELMYLPQRGHGEYGEVYATGWGCTVIPGVRICV